MTFKRILPGLCVSAMLLGLSPSAFAEVPDLAAWNECALYSVLNDGGDSNSSVDYIAIRVKPEPEANQLHMLFLADLTSFDDESKAGIKMEFNNIGTVSLFCDGRQEYDNDLFFAEIDNVFSDSLSMMLGIELTVGIKPGIPDNTIIKFNLYDTHGIATNTYSVDITDSYAEVDEQNLEINSTEKTSKTRSTKLKTQKAKSTKIKTTRRTDNKASEKENYEVEENKLNLRQDSFEDVYVDSNKTKLIIICVAAVIASTAGGCTIGIINSRKNKNGGGSNQK